MHRNLCGTLPGYTLLTRHDPGVPSERLADPRGAMRSASPRCHTWGSPSIGEQRRPCRMPGGGLSIRMADAAEDLFGRVDVHQLRAPRPPLAVGRTGQ